ncbi:YpzI family protein [Litchfieldia salsa]|uniref:YpzI-like protein n=1 Tax=Litchfieldia salsa TaxID=930152 RepID=A0A1H0WFC3_9BACI|nr:YpzI family protein [Litchfieldia salsa]SDP89430.1 YpzI-like protein [Litchfieldia salsa]
MGKDRQEKKLRERNVVRADRDPELHNPGATKLEGPEEARERNEH